MTRVPLAGTSSRRDDSFHERILGMTNHVTDSPSTRRPAVAVLSREAPRRPLKIIEADGVAEAIVWPGMGAQWRSLHRIVLGPQGRTIELAHESEAVYFVRTGTADVTGDDSTERLSLVAGSMVHIGPRQRYRFVADNAGAEILGGPCPPDDAMYHDAPSDPARSQTVADAQRAIRTFHCDSPSHVLPLISSDARLVVWPGVGGADMANLNYVAMQPGEANTPHAHPTSEDTIYILEGAGSIEDITNGAVLTFHAGDVVHVPPGVRHAVRADQGERVVSFGGPCPPDLTLLGHAIEVPTHPPLGR